MGTKKAGRSHRVNADGTWVDRSVPGDRELIARGRQLELAARQAEIEAKTAARRHYLRMQAWVLVGVGALIVLTIVALVVGLWLNAINSNFATELARTTLPILLGALATIVGAFFGVGANINPNSEDGGRGFHIRSRGHRQRGSRRDR
jgi:hypothetical protein